MRNARYLVAAVLLSIPGTGWAAEGGGLGSLISLEPGSTLYTLITFVLLLLILWKFAWGPIVKGLEAREEKIHGAIEQAKRDREQAEQLLREYEEKLKSASQEISERLTKADKDAQARVEQARAEATEEGNRLLARAKDEIEAQKQKVSAELRAEVAELASSIASAAISESFGKEDHLRIIRKRLEQVEKPS